MTPLTDFFAERRLAVEARLGELFPAYVRKDGIGASLAHSLLAPAKRARAVLTLTAASALGGSECAALDAACALEMVHAASLILDDLPSMDNAELRRGLPANHRVFGEATAILAAIGLLNDAYGAVARAPVLDAAQRIEIVECLSASVGLDGLVKGQFDDLGATRSSMTATDLERMYARKTGALFAAAAECGAIVAGKSHLRAAMASFGRNLGVGFQVLDDVLDAAGKTEGTGKDVSNDGSRKTFVTLLGAKGCAIYGREKIVKAVADAETAAAGDARIRGQLALYAQRLAGSFAKIIPEFSAELAVQS